MSEVVETAETTDTESANPDAEDLELLRVGAGEDPPNKEPPTEPVAPSATPEPEPTPKETALFARALREREKATKAIEQVKAERAAFEREKEEIYRLRAEAERIIERNKRVEADPWSYFDEFNVDRHDHARRLMSLNTPEAQEIDRVKRELREEREKREARDAAEEERRKAADAERQAHEVEQYVSQAKQDFVSFLDTNAAAYPEIADEDPEELAEVMWDLASQHHKATGSTPTFEMVAAHLNKASAEKRAKREERRQKRGVITPASTDSDQRSTQGRQPSPGPRTLTNSTATQRTVVPPPKVSNIDDECLAILRESSANAG